MFEWTKQGSWIKHESKPARDDIILSIGKIAKKSDRLTKSDRL